MTLIVCFSCKAFQRVLSCTIYHTHTKFSWDELLISVSMQAVLKSNTQSADVLHYGIFTSYLLSQSVSWLSFILGKQRNLVMICQLHWSNFLVKINTSNCLLTISLRFQLMLPHMDSGWCLFKQGPLFQGVSTFCPPWQCLPSPLNLQNHWQLVLLSITFSSLEIWHIVQHS